MSRVIHKRSSTSQRSNYSNSNTSSSIEGREEESERSNSSFQRNGNGRSQDWNSRAPYDQRSSRKRTNRTYDDEEEVEVDDFQPSSRSSKRGSKRKELCDLGMTCPYINEFQHRLEFDHQEQEEDILRPSGRSNPHPPPPPIIPFNGNGNVLGGFCVRSERNIDGRNPQANKRSERLPSNMPTKKQKKNAEQYQSDYPDSSSGNQQEPLHVICDICHKAIDLYNWDMHALSHERNQREQPEVVSLVSPEPKHSTQQRRNQQMRAFSPSSSSPLHPPQPSPRTSLRSEQDRDYESAVMEDIMKQSKLEFDQYLASQKNREAQEEEILNGLLQTTSINHQSTTSSKPSFRSLKAEDSRNPQSSSARPPMNLITLSPPRHQEVSVAFRLPRTRTVPNTSTTSSSTVTPAPAPGRIVHTFSTQNTIQDIFSFLTSLPSLQGRTDLELHSVVASDGLKLSQQSLHDCQLYLKEARIIPNTVLVVFDPLA